MTNLSSAIASLLGPTLVALSLSEALHLSIWADVDPTVVYLNGLLLFVAGLAIVRFHNRWKLHWSLLVTLLGWTVLLAGTYRMFFPRAPQLESGPAAYALISFNLLAGAALTLLGWKRN